RPWRAEGPRSLRALPPRLHRPVARLHGLFEDGRKRGLAPRRPPHPQSDRGPVEEGWNRARDPGRESLDVHPTPPRPRPASGAGTLFFTCSERPSPLAGRVGVGLEGRGGVEVLSHFGCILSSRTSVAASRCFGFSLRSASKSRSASRGWL